jgi:hypothetical protein
VKTKEPFARFHHNGESAAEPEGGVVNGQMSRAMVLFSSGRLQEIRQLLVEVRTSTERLIGMEGR